MKVKIYIEGGGDREDLKTEARKAFKEFFERPFFLPGKNGQLHDKTFKTRLPTCIPCGSRSSAFNDFKTALSMAKPGEFVMLLVDSEAPVAVDTKTDEPVGPWKHLETRVGDAWAKPASATDDHAHLMVQCMETWFLADKDTLKHYFDPGFKAEMLIVHPKLEVVGKSTVFKELTNATASTKTKGKYDDSTKGTHSFKILAKLDPEKVRKACPHAERLLKTLDQKL